MQKLWDHKDILKMADDGASASVIQHVLNLPVSVRQVQRILQDHRGRRARKQNGRLEQDALGAGALRSIIVQLMTERGHNIRKCDLCGRWQPRNCDIHHTKYEGATLEDLVFACHRCNMAPENLGLA